MEFNIGDRVIVHKPRNGVRNCEGEPVWVSPMDKYDGTEQRISNIYYNGTWVELHGQIWTYGSSWLSHVVTTTEDDFEAEDLGCLM